VIKFRKMPLFRFSNYILQVLDIHIDAIALHSFNLEIKREMWKFYVRKFDFKPFPRSII